MRFFFIPLVLCFCLPAYSDEQNIFLKIDAAVNPASASVGSNIEYTVNIAGDDLNGVETELPEKRELYLEDASKEVPVYIINSAAKDSSQGLIAIKITISFYRPGTWALPEIKIYGSDKIRVGYNVPNIDIMAVNEQGEFVELEEPLDMGVNYRKFFLIFAALTALGLFAFWLLRRLRKQKAKIVPPEDPFDLFTRELDAIGGNKLIYEGKIDEYAFGISIIFRRFLSRRFGFDAAEMTTGEIRGSLSKALRSREHAALLDDIIKQFDLWDLSKFAEFTPDESVMLQSHDDVIRTALRLARGWDDGTVSV
ncbi:MAG: hypothetical protein FWG13_02120 [Leptospirales bacterium]|nr:hypothetical protein [Leptospirales bacterium]